MAKITGTKGNNTLNDADVTPPSTAAAATILTRAEGELELAATALLREAVDRNSDQQ